jgi:hypothetical protein
MAAGFSVFKSANQSYNKRTQKVRRGSAHSSPVSQ